MSYHCNEAKNSRGEFAMLQPGLYEQVINNALSSELSEIPEARKSTAPIDTAEASKVLAQYLTDVVQKGLENVQDNGGGHEAQIQLANQIVNTIQNTTQEADFASLGVDQRAEQLLALLRDNDPRLATGKSAKELERPETSIAQSSLFTGAIHEPQMYTELKKEIVSADRIDMLVSFIKWSGLRLIMDELRQFTQSGGELRIITTSYMGATDVKAIEELRQLPNTKIKVSYDTKRTRLHAKTYVFYRDTGFTTAYVGSSNLSNAAISSGLEWNVKVTKKDLPETIEHAQFMADYFNARGIPSMALTGDSPDEERNAAKQRLVSGELRFLFVVDIYNEGVDIPEVNTVLFLRPTESLTVFLQQLGRGLRLAENKECLTVLDFIGQANKKYNFEEKFAALLSNTTRSVSREIKEGFLSAPKGCYIQLEKIAAKYVLDNISASYDRTSGLVARAASFTEDTGLPLTLGNFLDYYHLDPRAIYSKKVKNKNICFTRLCVLAGTASDFSEPLEEIMTKALARFAVVDSRRWIQFLLNLLPKLDDTDFAALSPREQRMLQMFYVTVWGKAAERWDDEEVLDNLYVLSDSPVLLSELQTLLHYQYNRIDFIDEPVDVGFDCPLDLHCTYTRDQLLVALDFLKPATVREGVKWLPDKNLDVFFVTLNKADKDYSPTTMYKDYSINESLFHWQSQSTTAENSATGQRYIHHREKGSRVLLFVREFKSDSRFGGAAAYTYLGTVNYVTHEGSRPMNITWKLDRPIPARFLKKTNKLVVG